MLACRILQWDISNPWFYRWVPAWPTLQCSDTQRHTCAKSCRRLPTPRMDSSIRHHTAYNLSNHTSQSLCCTFLKDTFAATQILQDRNGPWDTQWGLLYPQWDSMCPQDRDRNRLHPNRASYLCEIQLGMGFSHMSQLGNSIRWDTPSFGISKLQC